MDGKTQTMSVAAVGLRSRVVKAYLLLFYALAVYRWVNGLWMYQLQPFLFKTRQDIFTWVFMQTRLHLWLAGPSAYGRWIFFDLLFYSAPLVYYLVFRRWASDSTRWGIAGAIYLLLVQWTYIQCYTLFGTPSIEGLVGYMLLPIAFLSSRESTFDLLWEGLRYFFLFFFASAGCWKLVQGGIYHLDQMSAILQNQHLERLTAVSGPSGDWYGQVIRWLVNHPLVSYGLYGCVTLAELSFLVGFFTRKWDKWLGLIFVLFLLLDKWVMGIDYMDMLVLALTLWIPAPSTIRHRDP
jgi:hypothetical protein